jgi:hypothetical protein
MSYEIIEIGLLTAKIESTYGTDPVPTIGANAIPTIDALKWDPASDALPRKPFDGAIIAPIPGYNTMKRGKISFTYELRGNRTNGVTADISSGSSANAVEIDALLKACNLTPVYTPESGGGRNGSVNYYLKTFTDNTDPSVTLYWYTQRKLHKLTGARGTVKFRWSADKMVYADFEFTGFYIRPADNTFPTQSSITFLDTKPPLFSLAQVVSIGSYATARIQNAEFDIGNEVVLCPDALATNGIGRFLIVDRSSKGKIDPEADEVANWGIFADWEASTPRAVTVGTPQGGSVSGNILQMSATAEFKNVPYADRNKVRTHGLDFDIVRSALSSAETTAFSLTFA